MSGNNSYYNLFYKLKSSQAYSFLSAMSFLLKTGKYHLTPLLYIANVTGVSVLWADMMDAVENDGAFETACKTFTESLHVSDLSLEAASKDAVQYAMYVVRQANRIEGKEDGQISPEVERLLHDFDLAGLTEEEFRLAMASAEKIEDIAAAEYAKMEELMEIEEYFLYKKDVLEGIQLLKENTGALS